VEERQVKLNSLPSRLGGKTIELRHVSKSYGNVELIHDFSYNFGRTDRIGIIGPNGCGKSTLLKIIEGRIPPDSGEVEIGQTVKIGCFSQENERLDPDERVIDYIKDTAEFIRTADGLVSASSMCEQFLFDSEMQYSLIGKLSGGEKRRLYLLKVLMEAPNVLITG
jgi:ATP-binding cassette subfamily F protein uup